MSPVDVPTSGSEAGSGTLDAGSVAARWPEVLAALKEGAGPRVLAYFHGSSPVALEDDVVRVSFTAEFHRNNATKAQDEFADATEAVFGRRLRISEAAAGSIAADDASGAGDPVDAEDPDEGDEPIPAESSGSGATEGGLSSVLDLVTSELGGEVVERREPQ